MRTKINSISKLLSILLIAFSFNAMSQNQSDTEVDEIFKSWNNINVPGGAVAIIEKGKIIFEKGYGSADLEHDIPITPETVFYIGSVSKQFVTFCILLLEEEDKLNLDDKIQKYFPDFPEYDGPLTIRNFIHHTSGVRDYLTLMHLKGRSYLDHITEEEVYEIIKNQREPNFTPGDRYLYSNSCYFMLALIVEKVSGQSIREYAKANIFDPLEMDDTQFYDDNTKLIRNRAFSYSPGAEGFNNLILRFDLVGSGGIYSTVLDLYKWDQNFYNNKLGKGGQAIMDKMHQNGVLNNGEEIDYAFAIANGKYRGLETAGHGGALAGYRAQLLRFPEQDFSVAILSNRSNGNPGAKSYQIADLYLDKHFVEEVEEEKTKEPQNQKLKIVNTDKVSFEGTYELQPGITATIKVTNDTVFLRENWDNVEYPILPNDDYHFKSTVENVLLSFSGLENGFSNTLIANDNGTIMRFKRINPFSPNSKELSKFEGRYYSQELDVYYTLEIDPESNKLTLDKVFQGVLIQTDHLSFSVNGNIFNFIENQNMITGFTLDAGRVQNLIFEKVD